jgi:hypothetical protein
MDFLHEVQFFAGIGHAHFPAETTRPLGPRLSAIFTFFLSNTVRKTRCKDNDFFAIIGKEKDKNALFEGIN